MNKRGVFTALAWLLLTCSLGHAQDKASQPVLQLMGGGTVAPWTGEPLEDPASSENPIEWRYPVFKGGDKVVLERLNVWTRTMSLEGLLSYEEALLQKAIPAKDSDVLAMLANDKAARESAMKESTLAPSLRFARHITFDHHIEVPGNVPLPHSVTLLVFDLASGRQVPISSLFKSNAERELESLLRDEIARGMKSEKEADIEYCQHKRSFGWGTMSIQSSTEIALQFRYTPGDNTICGEGNYVLRGPAVRKLFLSPRDFNKGRKIFNYLYRTN